MPRCARHWLRDGQAPIRRWTQAAEEERCLLADALRGVQRIREHDRALVPDLVRAAFPAAQAGPVDVAAFPLPTYDVPGAADAPPSSRLCTLGGLAASLAPRGPSPGALADDGGGERIAPYWPGSKYDWQERPPVSRALRQPSGAPAAPAAWRLARPRQRATVHGRHQCSMPMLVALDAPAAPTDALARGRQAAGVAAARRGAELGLFDAATARTACVSDHNTWAPRSASTRASLRRRGTYAAATPAGSADDALGARGEGARSASPSARAAVYATGVAPGAPGPARSEAHARARVVAMCVAHMRSAANASRAYDCDCIRKAALGSANTFARPPRALHLSDVRLASPCERIAANLSPLTWRLSARTLPLIQDASCCARLRNHTRPSASAASAAAEQAAHEPPDPHPTLPLELFDPAAEDADRLPEEWVALRAAQRGTRAWTAWLNTRTCEYEQRAVRVRAYCAADRTFTVEFEVGQVVKPVKRLNLRFDAEDAAAFARRVAAARQARLECERALRRRAFLESSAPFEVVDTYRFDAKVHQVWQATRRIQETIFLAIKEPLSDAYSREYRLAVKSAILDYHLLDPRVADGLAPLKLRQPESRNAAAAAAAREAAATCPRGGISAAAAALAPCSMLSDPALRQTLQAVHDACQRIESQPCFGLAPATPNFDLFIPASAYTQADAGPRPYSLEQLETILHSSTAVYSAYVQAVQLEVADACGSAMVSPSRPAIVQSLLLQASLKLQAACTNALHSSAESYVAYFESESAEELLLCELEVIEVEAGESGAGHCIELAPTCRCICDIILRCFDNMGQSFAGIDSIRNSSSRTGLDDGPAQALSSHGRAAQESLAAARVQLEAELQRALQPVARLQSLYMGVAADIANCCRSARSSSAEGSEDLDALAALVQRLDACKAKLQTLTVVKVHLGLLVVSVARARSELADHLSRAKEDLLSGLAARCRDVHYELVVPQVCSRCDELEAKLLRMPSSAAECHRLHGDIAGAKNTELDRLEGSLARSSRLMDFVVACRWPQLTVSDIEGACQAASWPGRLREAIDAAKAQAVVARDQFERQLDSSCIELTRRVSTLVDAVQSYTQLETLCDAGEHAASGRALVAELTGAVQSASALNAGAAHLGLPSVDWPLLAELAANLGPVERLWTLVSDAVGREEEWMDRRPAASLDAHYMSALVAQWSEALAGLKSAGTLPVALAVIAGDVQQRLAPLHALLPVLECLAHARLGPRLVEAVFQRTRRRLNPTEDTLQVLVELGVPALLAELQAQTSEAEGRLTTGPERDGEAASRHE